MTESVDTTDLTVEVEQQGVTPEELKLLFRDHPSGVAVVTAMADGQRVAMTASSLFSVSVAPPLVVFSASRLSSSTPTLLKADTVVVHLIDEDSVDVALLGATSGVDRFDGSVLWASLPTGEPYYLAPSKRFLGRVVQRIDAGAAVLFVVQAMEASADESTGRPLVYHSRTWHGLSEGSQLAV